MSLISKKHLRMALQSVTKLFNKRVKDSTADWSQNDPSADNFVKNRTHWEETKIVILLPEVAFEHDGSAPFCPLTPISPLVVGKEYVVTYDNVKYSCVAYPSSDDGVAVGNGALFIFGENEKDGNGEPFFFVNYHDDSDEDFSAIFPAEEGAHTMSIEGESIAVHKLDPKYLPDDIGVQADWNQDDSNAKDFIKNKPFYEGIQILFDGDLIVNQYGSASFDTGLSVNAGQEYTVIVDGMSMTGTARYTETEYTIGNGYYDEDGNRIFGADNYGIYIADDYYPEGTVIHATVSTYDVKQIDEKFIPNSIVRNISTAQATAETAQDTAEAKMNTENPTGVGSFSMNKNSSQELGNYSTGLGYRCEPLGDYSSTFGYKTKIYDSRSFVIGKYNYYEPSNFVVCSEKSSLNTNAGYSVYKIESYTPDFGSGYFIINNPIETTYDKLTYGDLFCSRPNNNDEVCEFISKEYTQQSNRILIHLIDHKILNRKKDYSKYILIAGNGRSDSKLSNAHTLDWNGVGWYQGGLQVGGNAQDDGAKNVLLEGDAIPVPEAAEIGQIVAVKAIDENGKPSEWETLDMPGSFVAQDTEPEDTSVLWVDTSDESSELPDGNADLTDEEYAALLALLEEE